MRVYFKRYISLLLSIFLSFSTFYITAYAEENEIIIYHTNDSHGYLQGDGEKITGISLAIALKNTTPNSILVDAGDATQGLPIASITKGADVIELMNMGYDVMVLGNHEFDFGVEQLLENVKKANFTVLSANVYKEDKPILKDVQKDNNGCHTIIERNGIKIGFFGLTTVQTKTATNPEGIKNVEFRDEIETAKKEIDELEAENADVIIAICHMGNGDAPCTSEDLANAMTEEYQGKLDAIIDGHSHTVENNIKNDVLIVQTGYGMSAIGELTVKLSGNDVSLSDKLLSPSELSDAQTDKKLEEINSLQQELLKQKVADSQNTLWAGWIGDICPARLTETNFGDFVADAFQNAAADFITDKQIPIVAVQNGGGIRETVPNGEITKGSLISAFPFSNTLYIKEVTPKILYEMMEVSGSLLNGQDSETGMLLQNKLSGGFLQISGFRVHFNPNASENKVVSITLEGQNQPLQREDDTTHIMLVSNNYIMSGGNDYTMLSDLPKYAEIGGELETIEQYLKSCVQNGMLKGYETTKNRIIIHDDYSPKNYTAFVKVSDENGNLKANQSVSYKIDGGQIQHAITDENAILSVNVSDGPHAVRIADTQNEVYIDNYSGIGLIEDSIRKFPVLTYSNDESYNNENIDVENNKTVVAITLNTQEIKIGEESIDIDCVPYISNGSIMIPLRAVSVAVFGENFEKANESNFIVWDDTSKAATIFTDESAITFTAGSEFVTIKNGNSFVMNHGVKAEIKNERMFVPLRDLAKVLDAEIEWLEDSKTALFTIL